MSRLIKWYIDTKDLEDLFESTFGPHYDFSVEWVEFDEFSGKIEIEILDELAESEDDGGYVGVRIA